jgi:tryptophan-rich protein/Big-like domain-containing protein/parallel beta helix pectate lyase-like protein
MAIAGFPDANSTGLPDGVTLTASGDVTVTKPGTVINALDVKGTISVLADNVTIQNCRITSTDWTGIWIKSGVTGTVVQDNEILNVGSSPDGANGIVGSGTFLRNDIHDVENGIIATGSSLIQDNYIHDMNAPNVRAGTALGGPHYDGIEIDGGVSGVVIQHNTVINENGWVSAVMINNDFGPVSNIKVDGNYLAGGGYTLYSDGSFSSTDKISGISFTNNELGQGKWGYYYFKGNTPVLSNNDELGTQWQTHPSTPSTPAIPAAPVIASWSPDTGKTGDGITDANKVSLHGTAAAGSIIKVYDGSTQIGSTTATSTGSWDYITSILTDAKHTLTATASNSSGQTSAASSALAVTVDTKVAAPTIAGDTVNSTNQVVASGNAEANSTIKVYDGTTQVGTATTNASGAWTVTTAALGAGAHALTATATDVAGNVSATSAAFNAVIGSPGSGSPAPTPPSTPTSPTPTPGKVIESAGATSLVESGDKYYLNSSSGSGPSLKYHGVDFVDGTDGTWAPIAAEKTATGYQVVWKEASTGLYTAWNTDNNGNYVSHVSTLTGSTSGGFVSNSGLKSLETSFHQDLNGDGQIGASSAAAPTQINSTGQVVATSGQVMVGTDRSNTLTSTTGNDVMVGKGGADTFVFASNFGKDVITDFTAGGPSHDTVQFSKSVFDSFASVLSHAAQSGQDVVISTGSDTLTLKNTKVDALHSNDFHFA